MERQYIIQYTVTGRTPFPHDMLRYDRAWPVDGAVLDQLCSPFNDGLDEVTVMLACHSSYPDKPTHDYVPGGGRWASFGWRANNDVSVIADYRVE